MLARLIILIAIAAVALPAVSDAETVGRGDMEFFLDTAVFRNEDGTSRQELYLRIPNTSMRFKQVDDQPQARIRLSIEIRKAGGDVVVDDSSEIDIPASSETTAVSVLHFQTMARVYNLEPGAYRLYCAVEDLYSPKVTIVGMIKGKVRTSVVQGLPLEVPHFPEHLMSVSDAKFLWTTKATGSPNPPRMYGLYRDSLYVYVEAYVPTDFTTDDLHLKTVIVDELGEPVSESSVVLPASGEAATTMRTIPILITEDLNRFPAGKYTLYVHGGHEEQLLVRVRSGNFNVAWDMRVWELSRRSLEYEARFLLEGEDFDEFITMSVGEQEALLGVMWKDVDPDPTTGVNEAYEEFQLRLEYVNAKYTDYQLGIFTDRGLIYLKFGPADEKIVDVIPANRESISDALEKVQDKYHAVNFSTTGGRIGYAQPSRNPEVDPRRLGAIGEGGNVSFPYELWLYNGVGQPLLARDTNMETDIGLRFIFVDREGFGRYRLESSSSMANK